ncbi:D-2-hydroxyacid dehydrogenase [Glaciecola sp. MF2-115]|uniref:D-2-hydroxyacid dehydrogenase n=1 Tax=Glaciecola sp. MF2-115 TaxID=3384827 RepID=UPI0039A0B1BC
MHRIVFLDSATIADNVLVPSPQFPHKWIHFGKTSAHQTLERVRDADIVITNKVMLDKQVLSQLPQLKHIAITATGTNTVDLDAAREHGISVSNVPAYASRSVSEHVLSMILALRRNLIAYREDISAGKWQASEQFCFHNTPIFDLHGSTIGLIGTGAIAQEVARLAKTFGMRVIFHSVSGRENMDGETLVALSDLLETSDIVSLHCPLTSETENLINAQTLKQMRSNALLINTARGSIVDLSALQSALSNSKIAGAGLDVAPEEPPADDSTIMQLNKLANCIVTPHSAWASQQSMQGLVNQVVKNIEAFVSGEALNIVN